MVKVLVISDEVAPGLHVQMLRDLSPDLVLSAGDLPWDYLEYVGTAVNAPLVFVPGNHDPALERAKLGRNGTYTSAGLPVDSPRPRGAVNADGRVVEAAGLRIAGLGGCVRYRPGAHQYTQRQYAARTRRLLRRARRGGPVDVLLTHAPPRGLGDGEDQPHEGIEALHSALARLEPTYHLHGHVHPYGQSMPDRQVGPTTVRNVIPWRVIEIAPRSGGSVTSAQRPSGTMSS
jgi:hypothetical protein